MSFLVAVSGIQCSADRNKAQMLLVSMTRARPECSNSHCDVNYTFPGKHDLSAPHFASVPSLRHFIAIPSNTDDY